MTNPQIQLFLQMALRQWESSCNRAGKILNSTASEKYVSKVAPGSNTVAWIFNHLTWVHDNMHPPLDFREPLFPTLDETLSNKKNPVHEVISQERLTKMWNEVNASLYDTFLLLSADQWLAKHTAVSNEDFQREPHRNKLNILLSRTAHLNHLLGQLALIE